MNHLKLLAERFGTIAADEFDWSVTLTRNQLDRMISFVLESQASKIREAITACGDKTGPEIIEFLEQQRFL